jgi:dolichyl-phosphate-mannose--protein O-mannosyl transferase
MRTTLLHCDRTRSSTTGGAECIRREYATGRVIVMYFLGAGVIMLVAILVIVVYFQQKKRRR